MRLFQPVVWFTSSRLIRSLVTNRKFSLEVCVNRFDDETKQAFIDLYDKVDGDFVTQEIDTYHNEG